ncbi:DUF4435 domain-containing protein [Luteibacter sp. Lutesp34]|uniref:DUF4435 domain-containing protein n=1 Tax=Luteibacter sp. Lutesp34 TaxID=3243030 RepID=UPI0039B3D2A4
MTHTDLAEKLRDSRKSPGVLKSKLISLRGRRPDVIVCVFEGPQDLGPYSAWLSKIDPRLTFAPLIGAGKEQVVAFADNLDSVDAKLGFNVFCFVDSDYDRVQPSNERTFVLAAYSIENALVGPEVIESLLVDEFGIHDDSDECARQVDGYKRCMEDFDAAAHDVHFKLFAGRRLKIRVLSKPDDVTDFVVIAVDTVLPSNTASVVLNRPLTSEEEASLWQEFTLLPMQLRQRGKYALGFMRKWLTRLTEDAGQATPVAFRRRLPRAAHAAPHVTLRDLALRASLPAGLSDFVERMSVA